MTDVNVGKIHDALDYIVLGVAIVSGLAGMPGLAIAGVAVYLTGVKLYKRV